MTSIKPGSWGDLRELVSVCARFFSASHKKKLLWVIFWALALSLGEMFVAASVIPYINCLNNACYPPVVELAAWLNMPVVVVISAGLFVLISIKLFIHAIFAWRSASLHQQVQRDSIQGLLAGFLHMEWQGFSRQHKTHYFRRCATTAVDASFVIHQWITLISSIILLIVLLGLMIWHNPLVSIILVCSFLLMSIGSQRFIGRLQKRAAQQREQVLQHYTLGMTDAFASFREIRVYQLEQFFLSRLAKSTAQLANFNRTLGFLPVLPRLFLDFSFVAVLLLVVSLWFIGEHSVAKLIPELIFYAVLARAMLPAMMDILSTRAALIGSAYNISLLLEEQDNNSRHYLECVSAPVRPAATAVFSFNAVSFSHNTKNKILDNVNVDIVHPSWVAVTGSSGVGKSTLLELLCGVLTPQEGEVVHYWPLHQASQKPNVAYLPQHVALIDGTLADNVVFGFDVCDKIAALRALELAQLGDFVNAQPFGLDSPIGADGNKLSGGQRQRLALARALYRKPDLLLLDEATSGLDEQLEAKCLESIKQACPEMTVVFITHRRSNLCFADKVLLLEKAQVHDVTDLRG